MKNKVLSILAIFITFITLSCKTDLIEKETTPQGKGLISIKIGNNAKMLSPNTDKIDISSINWTVTFTNKQDTTKQLKRSTSTGTLKEYLPFGTYIIEIEGITQSEEDGSTAIAFYGKTEAAISPEEKTTTANIYVAPKKSENGTGSFEYIITMAESEFLYPMDNTFSAKLSSVNNNSDPIEITGTVKENTNNEAYTTYTITFSQAEIPSGYYTLTISCTTKITEDTKTTTTQILQKDILVEICDNAKTSDSIELQIDGYKTLYAVTPESGDDNEYANYSGEFKQYPADFLNILNDDTITNATINMLPNNIPIINPSKIKDKFFDIYLYNESDPETTELYGYTYKDYNETKLDLAPNKSLMLLGNDNYEESILNLYIYTGDTSETTQVTLLNGSPSIYLSSSSSSSSKFKFNINETSNYHDKPFMQCDVPQDSDEDLLKILTDYNTKIESFDGIKLSDNYTDDKVVYTSTSKTIDANTCNNIQYFILPNHKGSMPDTIEIDADKTTLYIDEKVTFTIQDEFTDGTKFKWYANRKLVQDGPNKSYTHTAQFTTDEVLCFIYQDENNYITVDATELNPLNITPDTTPIALYSAASDYSLYNLTLADVKNISKGEKYLDSNASLIQNQDSMYYDNCYDNAGTLWWITDSWIYNSKNESLEMSNLRYIDFDTDTLSLYATGMDASYIIYKITGNNETYSYDTLFYIDNPITCITFHNDYCYTIEKVSGIDDGNTTIYTLKKYNLSKIEPTTGQLTPEKQTPLLTTIDDTQNEIITFSSLIFDNDNQIANTLKNPLFSDIQVTDEGIFVLFNDCYYNRDRDAQTIAANSRGGIIKFDNEELQLDTNFGSNGIYGIFGWTNEKHTSYGTNDITYTITSYMPDFQADTQLSSKYFYSPRKFLAIKPKKLIFADDGFMFYGNNDDPSGKDVNQVIEFDIKSAMFDSYNLGQSIDFNKRATPGSVAAGSFNWYD
ncbi:MAG: hypothetical protein J6J67_05315 [Treponema sp.]|nr:hypothetical protein [Treponema sp.]